MAGGYTLSLPGEDKSYMTKREMNEEIVTLLGGRVAEKLVLEDISTGASNDIERATKVARNMIMRYGFSEKLGPIVYGHDENEIFLGRDFSSTPSYSETSPPRSTRRSARSSTPPSSARSKSSPSTWISCTRWRSTSSSTRRWRRTSSPR